MVSEKKLSICHNKGFHIRFENGWTVSVQFGFGNYCDNYNLSNSIGDYGKTPMESNTAEVWCWNENDKKYPEEPTNNSTPEEILEIMNKVKGFTKEVKAE